MVEYDDDAMRAPAGHMSHLLIFRAHQMICRNRVHNATCFSPIDTSDDEAYDLHIHCFTDASQPSPR